MLETRVLLSAGCLYWSFPRLLELVVLRFRSEREKEIEIVLLRHQLRVWSTSCGLEPSTPSLPWKTNLVSE